MQLPATGPVTLRTNMADYPVTPGMKDGRVVSSIVKLNFCGPKLAHDGFKAMLREHAFDAGETAIVTYLQIRSYGKPWVLGLEMAIDWSFEQKIIPRRLKVDEALQ